MGLDIWSQKLRIRNSLIREGLAEFLGTFILLTFGDAAIAQAVLSRGSNGTPVSINFGWGLGVTFGIYVAGGVSGAHLNPAVTVAFACMGRLPWRKVPVYCIAQYIGAFSASACIYLVYQDALDHYDGGVRQIVGENGSGGIWSTYPQEYVSSLTSFYDQTFATGIMMICILGITDPHNMQPSKGVTALSVGFVIVALTMTFGMNCGGAFNPARDLSPRIFTAIAGWGPETFTFRHYNYFWVSVVGPHIGAILGAIMYQLCVGIHWPVVGAPENELNVNTISTLSMKQIETTSETMLMPESKHNHGKQKL